MMGPIAAGRVMLNHPKIAANKQIYSDVVAKSSSVQLVPVDTRPNLPKCSNWGQQFFR